MRKEKKIAVWSIASANSSVCSCYLCNVNKSKFKKGCSRNNSTM